MPTRVKRSEFAAFLKTGEAGTPPVPTWSRMGKGITGQTVSYNPTVTTEQYIDEDNATSFVDAYAPSINTPQTCYAGEAVFEFVDNLRQTRAVGADAETEVLLVYIYDSDGATPPNYAAEKCDAVISIEEFGGDAGAPTQITYTVNLNGDPKPGTCTITSGVPTFTAS